MFSNSLDLGVRIHFLTGSYPFAGRVSCPKNFFIGAIPELINNRLFVTLGNQRIAVQPQMSLLS